ncbi:MAG: hypothetical protein WAO12_04320 [Venatoribacter sp.]
MRWFVSLSCALLLAACSSNTKPPASAATQPPQWLLSPPTKVGMAYGVGSMENYGNPVDALQRATDLARADLVSQLKVTVSAENRSFVQEKRHGAQPSEVQQSLSQYVRSQIPTTELDEATLKDSYNDGHIVYALVELNRSQAAARLGFEIAELDSQLNQYLPQNNQGSVLERLQRSLPALKLFAKRERLNERLALFSLERKPAALPIELSQLQAGIYALLDALPVSLSVTGQDAPLLQASLLEALTSQGLKVGSHQPAELAFEVSNQIQQRAQNGGFYAFVHSQVVIKNQQGRVLASFSKTAKGVSGLEQVALQKAAQEAAKQISTELAISLVDRL